MREAVLRPPARDYRNLMSDTEYAQTERILDRLERDPSVDGLTTFAVPDLPGQFVFDDGTWRMVCSIPDEATVVIRAIAHTLDLPNQPACHCVMCGFCFYDVRRPYSTEIT